MYIVLYSGVWGESRSGKVRPVTAELGLHTGLEYTCVHFVTTLMCISTRQSRVWIHVTAACLAAVQCLPHSEVSVTDTRTRVSEVEGHMRGVVSG